MCWKMKILQCLLEVCFIFHFFHIGFTKSYWSVSLKRKKLCKANKDLLGCSFSLKKKRNKNFLERSL